MVHAMDVDNHPLNLNYNYIDIRHGSMITFSHSKEQSLNAEINPVQLPPRPNSLIVWKTLVCQLFLCAALLLKSDLAVSQDDNKIQRWLGEIAENSNYFNAELDKLSLSETKKNSLRNFYISVFHNKKVVSTLTSILQRHGYEARILELMKGTASKPEASLATKEINQIIHEAISRMNIIGRARIDSDLQRSLIEFYLALLQKMPRDVCARSSSAGLSNPEILEYGILIDDTLFSKAFKAASLAIISEAQASPDLNIPSDSVFRETFPLLMSAVKKKVMSRDDYTKISPFLDPPISPPPEIACEISKLYLEVVLEGFTSSRENSVIFWTALEALVATGSLDQKR